MSKFAQFTAILGVQNFQLLHYLGYRRFALMHERINWNDAVLSVNMERTVTAATH